MTSLHRIAEGGATPGPWFIEPASDEHEVRISTKQPEPRLGYTQWSGLAVVYGCDEQKEAGGAVALANARLIAAAPDLLAALLAFQKASGGDFIGWHPNYADAIELARKAIARATQPTKEAE